MTKHILYDKTKIDWEHLSFSNLDLRKLLIPLVIEQVLSSLMGMADTMMISRIGSAAISAVSLSDAINVLVIQVFAALSTGGTIICGQYIGHRDNEKSNYAAEQLMIAVVSISVLFTGLCLLCRTRLLGLVFGAIEPDVMENTLIYFSYTAVSFPFIALFQIGGAFFRAGGNSKLPMGISVVGNGLNIVGNALFIFVFGWGVAGAALATLISRIFCAVAVFAYLRLPKQPIVITRYLVHPDFRLIWRILSIGIPSGIENGMFQFGKLAVQSSVSTLGTTAIAAQAMTIVLEGFNAMAGVAIGIGLMTVVAQCIGAGKKEEAKYYIVKLVALSEVVVLISCLLSLALTKPVTILGGMEAESARQCFDMMVFITITKPMVWSLSFITAYGMRAAGDVRFSMIASSCTMWFCRVALAVFLIRAMGFGPIAVWIGMAFDWAVRAVIYTARFLSGRWLRHNVINE